MELCSIGMMDKITAFYRSVSDDTENMSIYGRWKYGIYPTDEIIENYVQNNQMYFQSEKDDILSVAALTNQNESYHGLRWSVNLSDDEVTVVHLLAINPKYQKKGMARRIMTEVIERAKSEGKKAVRLDALAGNQPAHKLYESLGFEKRDLCHWYADNTGWTDFCLFELIL